MSELSALAGSEGYGACGDVERVMGIEPTRPAWKAGILPLNYTRMVLPLTSANGYYHIFAGLSMVFEKFNSNLDQAKNRVPLPKYKIGKGTLFCEGWVQPSGIGLRRKEVYLLFCPTEHRVPEKLGAAWPLPVRHSALLSGPSCFRSFFSSRFQMITATTATAVRITTRNRL